MKKLKRTKVLIGAVVATVGVSGILAGGAQSEGPERADPPEKAYESAMSAYRAGQGRVLVPPKPRFQAVWRNGQMHIVQVVEKRILVGRGTEIAVISAAPGGTEAQLPPVDPALDNVQPTQAQIDEAERKVAALNGEPLDPPLPVPEDVGRPGPPPPVDAAEQDAARQRPPG